MMKSHANEVVDGLEGELESLWRFALRLTSDETDAADLVQRTCLRALEHRKRYRGGDRLRSWLFRIEHNIWRNELRARQVRARQSFASVHESGVDALWPGAADNDHSCPEVEAFFAQVCAMVESLPEVQRLTVLLVCMEGFSYQETAEILDVPVGTIMSRLSRGRAAIGQKALQSGAVTCLDSEEG